MKHFITLIICFIATIFTACEPEMDLNTYNPEIVVEGIVENGRFPTVMLSITIPIDMQLDSAEIASIPITWAKVTVSDGENEEVLTGMRNKEKLLQFEYQALHMRGETGKTYSLKVEYSGRTLTAKTTIPEDPSLEYIKTEKVINSDSLYSFSCKIENPQDSDYYLFQVKLANDSDVFRPCFLGAYEKSTINENPIPIYNSIRIEEDYSIYFDANKTYIVKLCKIGKTEYTFWKDYFNQILGTANPVYPVTSNLQSNINGGLGIWYGCGSKNYRIEAK